MFTNSYQTLIDEAPAKLPGTFVIITLNEILVLLSIDKHSAKQLKAGNIRDTNKISIALVQVIFLILFIYLKNSHLFLF